MAKKKLKKKSSKKKKSPKKQKKQQKEEKNELPEVDKELYEIQIADLTQKLKRAKEQYESLQNENADIRKSMVQLEEDRADVVAYLKQVLNSKIEEIAELDSKMKALQETREKENFEFTEKFSAQENEFKKMQEQLSTEINLLNGKLNMLDEFRVQKEDLMKQFQVQEENQKKQEIRHQETLHNIEKDFILKKIHMKKEVEERLIKLSEDFQTIMQSKIDSTTRVTIAENNALKREMNKIMETCKELIRENNDLKNNERLIQIKYSILRQELDDSIRKYIQKSKKLEEVRKENDELRSSFHDDAGSYMQKIGHLSDSLEEYKLNLQQQINVNEELRKNISLYQQQEGILNDNLKTALARVETTENVVQNAAKIIKEVVLDGTEETQTSQQSRTIFAASLLEILKVAKIEDRKNTIDFKLLKC